MTPTLDDFRKRLLHSDELGDNRPPIMRARIEVEPKGVQASFGSAPVSRILSPTGSISAAVRKAFAQIGSLQTHTEDFNQATEQLEQLNKSVAKIFEPLRSIYRQVSEVIGSFDALCALKSELASVSKDFEPMRLLHDQVSQLVDSVQIELEQLVRSLDPVQQLNNKVSALSRSLTTTSELHTDLADLHADLSNRQGSKTAPALGRSEQRATAA